MNGSGDTVRGGIDLGGTKIEAIVVVDEPRGAIYGTEVAAPAWKQIMNFALPYLKIAPG